MIFSTDQNKFARLKNDLHAFTVDGIPKGSKNARQKKRSLISAVSNAVDGIELDDFGVRVIVMKTTQ